MNPDLFALTSPNDPGAFSRGWVLEYRRKGGHFFIRHRVKGLDRKRLPPGHPPWLLSYLYNKPRWFYSLEAALAYAQAQISMETLEAMG